MRTCARSSDVSAAVVALARRVAAAAHRRIPVPAEDLRQVALLEAWQQERAYEPGRGVPFDSYARRAVHGACMMAGRRRAYREATHDQLDCDSLAAVMDLEGREEAGELYRLLESAMAELPRRKRELVELVYYDELPLAEVASRLGLSRTWAVIQHRRALAALRVGLERRGIHGTGDCL